MNYIKTLKKGGFYRPAAGRARALEIHPMYAFPELDAPNEAALPRLETTAAAAAALPPEIQLFS